MAENRVVKLAFDFDLWYHTLTAFIEGIPSGRCLCSYRPIGASVFLIWITVQGKDHVNYIPHT